MSIQCNLISEILEFHQAHKHNGKIEQFNDLMQMLRQYEYLWEYDNAKSDERKQGRLKAIEEYLLTLPLRIACSISTENKLSKGNVFYYEEYMIPQLLTEWIQHSTIFDGLTYQSASILSEAKKT